MASLIEILKTSAEQDAARNKEARRAEQKPDTNLLLRTESRELRTGLNGFMAVAAAALSPRTWLLGCASGLGRRNCRAPVGAPARCSGRLLPFYFLANRGAQVSDRPLPTHECGERPRPGRGPRGRRRERRNFRQGP